MRLVRLQVEGGFLDGLDLQLLQGLNVLAGGRGTGKTSIIELIRFALNIDAYNAEIGERAQRHALSILGEGRVVLTLDIDGAEVDLVRTAADESPRSSISVANGVRPILLSQTEIEHIGLDSSSRLRLLDGFRKHHSFAHKEIRGLLQELTDVAHAFLALLPEIDRVSAQQSALSDAPDRLRALEEQEAQLQTRRNDLATRQEELAEFDEWVGRARVFIAACARDETRLAAWRTAIEREVESQPPLESAGGNDAEAERLRTAFESVHGTLRSVLAQLDGVAAGVVERHARVESEIATRERRALEARRELELLQAGAGDLARRISDVRSQIARLGDINSQLSRLDLEQRHQRARLESMLEKLDALRTREYQERRELAESLSRRLGGEIQITVTRGGMWQPYANALLSSLRGSGLQYRELAPLIAERMSPRELAEAVLDAAPERIAAITDITLDRCARMVVHLREAGLAEILLADLQDSVEIRLMDGEDFKPTSKLSTGQRCTAVLPILLAHDELPLIIDQPEDHLDNRFIVETVVAQLRQRGSAQTIIASHNPNIPVLGDAAQVVQLDADGSRGFVRCQGPLSDPRISMGIVNLMEGGAEAFRQRFLFYGIATTVDG